MLTVPPFALHPPALEFVGVCEAHVCHPLFPGFVALGNVGAVVDKQLVVQAECMLQLDFVVLVRHPSCPNSASSPLSDLGLLFAEIKFNLIAK